MEFVLIMAAASVVGTVVGAVTKVLELHLANRLAHQQRLEEQKQLDLRAARIGGHA